MMIQMKDVAFRFHENAKRNILDHIDLEIREGTLSVIMGSSGCGKSTLAAVLAGLYPENGGFLECGTILLNGKDVRKMDPQQRAAHLTLMFQNPDLQFCMGTLRDEMRFCLENIRIPAQEMDTRILAAARETGTEAFLDREPHSLSGGEKQRAALCCLIVMNSPCILLDEPFANIDPAGAAGLIALLSSLRSRGHTVVVVDHQPGPWLETADEFIILGEGGRVLRRGIHAQNLQEHLPLLQEQGLFYPGAQDRQQTEQTVPGTAITVSHLTVPRGFPKKHWFHAEPRVNLIEDASLSFPEGRMTAVLGPSGSGKTTAFLAMLRQHPFSGSIRFGSRELSRIPRGELYRMAGIVFQNPGNQFITQNVMDEVTESLRLWNPGQNPEEREREALQLLEDYGLARFAKFSPYMLSQGQQRRLAVLSVLCGGQKILFLDEPTYGQDLRSTTAIMRQLRRKTRENGLTVIFITHDVHLANDWADKIYRLTDKRFEEVPS